MGSPQITLIGGGVRSGKSAYAVKLALAAGSRRTFIATAQAFDHEMKQRITAHQAERGAAFTTLEAPLALGHAIAQSRQQDVVLIDCVTLWLSNRLLEGAESSTILRELQEALDLARGGRAQVIFVTNEVGMGIVPESALGRAFRDLAGHANQLLARQVDRVCLATMGLILQLRPGPCEVVHPELKPGPRTP